MSTLRKRIPLFSAAILMALPASAGLSRPAFAETSVSGSGGTITVTSSGSYSSRTPGSIVSSSETTYTYYDGWPVRQTVPTYYVYMPRVIVGGGGYSNEPCLTMTASSKTTSYEEAYQLQFAALQTWNALDGQYPACTGSSVSTKRRSSVTPAEVVTRYWNSTIKNQLPVPRFSIPPGFAETGLEAYVVTTCNTPQTFRDPTPYGTAVINATGTLWVKWSSGDSWSGPYGACGLPWPKGTISHIYQTGGTAAVSAKETWIASWHLAGTSGTLNQLFTSSPTLLLPIHSITSEIYK